ncbi:MAG: hypothetical protein ACKPKO_56655, partial [Candidatus Fonsibacter sp.]
MKINRTCSEFTVPETSIIYSQLSLPHKPYVRTSASEFFIGGALARAWPPAPPPKAGVTSLGYHLGRAIPHTSPTESQNVKRRRRRILSGSGS